jgi:hypothetical protein
MFFATCSRDFLDRDRHSFLSSFVELASAVDQVKGEKADHNPEQRTENSEPKGDIPVCASDDRDFTREYLWMSCHELTAVSTVSLLTSAQSKILKRVRREIAGYAQAMAALVTRDGSPRFRTDYSVDLSAIITLPCELLLDGNNG